MEKSKIGPVSGRPDEEHTYACWLAQNPYIGGKTAEKLLQLGGSYRGIREGGEKLWGKVMNASQLKEMRKAAGRTPEEVWESLERAGIRFLLREDAEYPARLRDIPDPPYALFVRGAAPDAEPAVAVIGARECSEYGRYVARALGQELGTAGISVISGMARGIDGVSQNAALEAGGRSWGVLGCGVDICYPRENRMLYDCLAEQGGLLSEYAPGTPALPAFFPPRNRIVSGLADALVVIEARAKSGTLITVDMALEQGREVYVVPGRITDRLSDGCNRLLTQGAGVFLSPERFVQDFLESWEEKRRGGWHIVREEKAESRRPLPPGLQAVYELLDFTPQTAEQLCAKAQKNCSARELTVQLTRLCMAGAAEQIGAGWYVRK